MWSWGGWLAFKENCSSHSAFCIVWQEDRCFWKVKTRTAVTVSVCNALGYVKVMGSLETGIKTKEVKTKKQRKSGENTYPRLNSK